MSRSKKPTKQPPEGERTSANPLDEYFAQIFRDAQQPPDDRPEWIKELDKKLRETVFKDDNEEWNFLVASFAAAHDEFKRQGIKFLKERYSWAFTDPPKLAEIIDLATYRKNMRK